MSEGMSMEEQKDKALTVLGRMFDLLGLEAALKVEEQDSDLLIKIASDDAGRIIGRKGQTLESLQLLLNRIMFHGEENCPRVTLDIDSYARGSREPRPEDDRRERRDRGERRERREHSADAGEGAERSERPPRRRSPEREDGASEQELAQLALDRAKEVKRWGESVTLPAMNARDRRIIHVTLQDDAELETTSEGEGALKKVIISLKKSE